MPYVDRPGSRIHYTTHGAENGGRRTSIVLIQGLGLSSRFWFDVPQRLTTDPALGRHVIAIDNRGTGKSGRPRPPWSMGTMADDVAAVLDACDVESAIIVGISMGGMIAQHVALRHPKRVSGLILLATTPGVLVGQLPQPTALYRLLSLPFGGLRASRNLTRLLLPESKWHRAHEIFRDWPNAMKTDPTTKGTFAGHLLAAAWHRIGPRAHARIACPVLVVAGAEDQLMPRRNAELLASRMPRGELVILPDTGHAVFADDRDLIGRLVGQLEAKLPVVPMGTIE